MPGTGTEGACGTAIGETAVHVIEGVLGTGKEETIGTGTGAEEALGTGTGTEETAACGTETGGHNLAGPLTRNRRMGHMPNLLNSLAMVSLMPLLSAAMAGSSGAKSSNSNATSNTSNSTRNTTSNTSGRGHLYRRASMGATRAMRQACRHGQTRRPSGLAGMRATTWGMLGGSGAMMATLGMESMDRMSGSSGSRRGRVRRGNNSQRKTIISTVTTITTTHHQHGSSSSSSHIPSGSSVKIRTSNVSWTLTLCTLTVVIRAGGPISATLMLRIACSQDSMWQ